MPDDDDGKGLWIPISLASPCCVNGEPALRFVSGWLVGGPISWIIAKAISGAVLNVAIDRYAYAHLTFLDADWVRFRASDVGISEQLKASDELPTHEGLALHRAVYNRVVRDFLGGAPPVIDVSTTVDAPPGSGLGSSSALVVALVEVYRRAFSLPLGPYDVARLAYVIERCDLALAGGKQDHYSAAFGGVNFMEFLPNDRVIVNPLRVSHSALNELEAALIICFTGQSRRSDTIIGEQVRGIREGSVATIDGLHLLKADAVEMKVALLSGDLRRLAAILDRSWRVKQMTACGISNPADQLALCDGNGARCVGRQGFRRRRRGLHDVCYRSGEPLQTHRCNSCDWRRCWRRSLHPHRGRSWTVNE